MCNSIMQDERLLGCTEADGEYTCHDDKFQIEEMCEHCKDEFIQKLVTKSEYKLEGDR